MKKLQLVLVFLLGVAVGLSSEHLVGNMLGHHDEEGEVNEVQYLHQGQSDSVVAEQASALRIDTLDKAIVLTPRFSRIDLVCGQSPSENDANVLLAAEAAFTGKQLQGKTFAHNHIAGNHVSGCVYRKGYACADNTGAFVWTRDYWRFVKHDIDAAMTEAADRRGTAFAQVLFIHQSKRIHCNIAATQVFRALCQRRGQLCVIESRAKMRFYDFVLYLLAHNVEEALYLDSGKAFAHDDNGTLLQLTQNGRSHGTNWLTFYW